MRLKNFLNGCVFCLVFLFIGEGFIYSQTDKKSVKDACEGAYGGEALFVFEDAIKSKTLSGKIFAESANKFLISDAKVLITDKTYSEVFEETVTDENGFFSFPDSPKGIHYIYVCKEGYNNTQAKIKISKKKKVQNSVSLELNIP